MKKMKIDKMKNKKKELTIIDKELTIIDDNDFFIINYSYAYLESFFLRYRDFKQPSVPDAEDTKYAMYRIKDDVIQYMRRFDIFLTPKKGVSFFLKGLKIFSEKCNNHFYFFKEGEPKTIFENFLPFTLNTIEEMKKQVEKSKMLSNELGLFNYINSPASGMWTNILKVAIDEIITEIIKIYEEISTNAKDNKKTLENALKNNEEHTGQ